jgi:hypothetical protein
MNEEGSNQEGTVGEKGRFFVKGIEIVKTPIFQV